MVCADEPNPLTPFPYREGGMPALYEGQETKNPLPSQGRGAGVRFDLFNTSCGGEDTVATALFLDCQEMS